jgi:hypothetical protein
MRVSAVFVAATVAIMSLAPAVSAQETPGTAAEQLAYVPRQGDFNELTHRGRRQIEQLVDPSLAELAEIHASTLSVICLTNSGGWIENWYALVKSVEIQDEAYMAELQAGQSASLVVVGPLSDGVGTTLAELEGQWTTVTGQFARDGESCLMPVPPLTAESLRHPKYVAQITSVGDQPSPSTIRILEQLLAYAETEL